FLTGRFRSPADLPEGDTRAERFPRFSEDNWDANLRIVERVEELARRREVTPGQVALAWVLSRGADVVPIPGTKTLRYLEENVDAANVVFEPGDLDWLEDNMVPAAGARYSDMSHVSR
ncbi:MAG: aldo/keto reductase, partial [Acidimicrobiales bacterium]